MYFLSLNVTFLYNSWLYNFYLSWGKSKDVNIFPLLFDRTIHNFHTTVWQNNSQFLHYCLVGQFTIFTLLSDEQFTISSLLSGRTIQNFLTTVWQNNSQFSHYCLTEQFTIFTLLLGRTINNFHTTVTIFTLLSGRTIHNFHTTIWQDNSQFSH